MPPKRIVLSASGSSDKEKIKELHKKSLQLKERIDRLKKQIDEKDCEIGRLQSMFAFFGGEYVSEIRDNNDNQRDMRIDELEKQIHQKDKEIERLQSMNEDLSTRNSLMEEELRRIKAMVYSVGDIDEKTIGLKGKSPAQVAVDLTVGIERLSQVTGSKLTDNNPVIPELSDPNRPLNLAEMFWELYDNQWTDAMEELESKVGNEKQAIQNLLKIVLDAHKFCLKKSEQYFNSLSVGIKTNFQTQDLSSLQLKLMKDHRKAMAVHLVTDLQEEFCTEKKSDGEQTTAYQKQCIMVCWFMAVQDPPVYIDHNQNVAGNKFDTDKYRHYTRTGKVADYVVWPILYLHKDGPILGKGVAQGK